MDIGPKPPSLVTPGSYPPASPPAAAVGAGSAGGGGVEGKTDNCAPVTICGKLQPLCDELRKKGYDIKDCEDLRQKVKNGEISSDEFATGMYDFYPAEIVDPIVLELLRR